MKTYDERWYGAYQELLPEKATTTVLRDVPDLGRKKAAFITDGFTSNPDLTPKIDPEVLNVREAGVNVLHCRIAEHEESAIVRAAYLPLLEGMRSTIRLQKAAAKNDVDEFVATTQEAYGALDSGLFNCFLSDLHDWVDDCLHQSHTPAVKLAAMQVKDVLPETGASATVWPDERQFDQVQGQFSGFFDEMFAGIEFPDTASGETAKKLAAQVLKNLGLSYRVVDQASGVSTMAVNHKEKKLKIPPDEQYARQRLQGLLGHEIGIHAVERVEGERQPLRILSRGLKGSLAAEEGKGLLVEEIVYEEWDEFKSTKRFFEIARRYLSIGLARGLDGNGERDFKEVFTIMNSLDRLWAHMQDPDNPHRALAQSIDATWELLTKRTLKGVFGKGAAHFRDKVYAEGNLKQWSLLLVTPEAFGYLNKGKYDLTNPMHVHILQEVGTIPVALAARLASQCL